MSTFNNLKYKYNNLDTFGKLIVVNTVIFVIDILIKALFRFDTFQYFVLPVDLGDFILQPWGIITYGFIHSGPWHLLFNMLFLFYLSRVAVNLFSQKLVLNIYFLGVICGGILYLIVANLVPLKLFDSGTHLVGASAGVSALLLFVAVYMPNSEIQLFGSFTVKWKHIAYFFVGLDVLRMLMGLNQGGYMAHIGGYLLGFYYATQLQKGNDIGKGFERLMDTFISWFTPKSNLKTVHKGKTKNAYTGNSKSEFDAFNKQKRIDMILDKISKSGYDSLTKAEKDFLFRAGKD